MENVNTVVIARGLPGSGKSYTVGKIGNEAVEKYGRRAVICSADHFFYDAEGIYRFDFNLLGRAHAACRDKFVKALEENIPLVIVDNTNTKYSELRDYVIWAAIADYRIQLVESSAPWARDIDECFKRNSHGVPLSTIISMKERYQPNEVVARFCMENLGVKVEWA